MAILFVYNPVVGGLIPGGPKEPRVAEALNEARIEVGEAAWKAGYRRGPGQPTTVAMGKLKGIGIEPVKLSGVLSKVATAATGTADGKNEFVKLRATIGGNVLSLDLDTEAAMRLVQKLANVSKGQSVVLSIWADPVTRGNREYVNQCVSLKGEDGREIPCIEGFWKVAQAQADQVESQMKAMRLPPEVIKAAKASAKAAAHRTLADEIAARFVSETNEVPA